MLRLLAFSASTLVGTAVDTAVLWLCAHVLLDEEVYFQANILSPTISFFFATIANYIVAYYCVWRDRIPHRSGEDFLRRYIPYLGTCVGGFLIKLVILQFLCLLIAADVVWLNLVAVCFSGLFNFAINEWVVFRNRK